jgi:hypothetical protein
MQQRRAAQRALAAGLALRPDAPVLAFIEADVAFHTALYRLSGNRAIEDTVAAQWPHLKRSMGTVLDDPEHSARWSGRSTRRSSASFSPAMPRAPSARPEAIPTAPAANVTSGAEACADPEVEVIVEATGSPPAGIAHARATIAKPSSSF